MKKLLISLTLVATTIAITPNAFADDKGELCNGKKKIRCKRSTPEGTTLEAVCEANGWVCRPNGSPIIR